MAEQAPPRDPQKQTVIFDYWTSLDSPKVQRYLQRAPQFEIGTAEAHEDERLLERYIVPVFKGKTVLDVGAGPGRLVKMFTRGGCTLTAADWSDPFLLRLQRVCARYGARAVKLDICAAPLNETFDLVFATQVLLHIHPDKVADAIRNMAAMSRGDVIIITWQDAPPYDTGETDKHQSFNHDYLALFKDANLFVDVELDLYFQPTVDRRQRRVTNKAYLLKTQGGMKQGADDPPRDDTNALWLRRLLAQLGVVWRVARRHVRRLWRSRRRS